MEYSKIKKSLKKFGLNFNNKIIKAVEDIHKNEGGGGITVALDCPILNPYSEELWKTFDVAGLSEQLNYLFNSAKYMDLRKYFSHLNAEVTYSEESYINLHLGYTWDDGSYFGASINIAEEMDQATETGDIVLVIGELHIDEQADRYTDDFETLIFPLLYDVLEKLQPAKVLKIGKANVGN